MLEQVPAVTERVFSQSNRSTHRANTSIKDQVDGNGQ